MSDKKEKINNQDNSIEDNKKLVSVVFIIILLIVSIAGISYINDKYLSNYFNKTGTVSSISEEQFLESYEPIKNVNDDDDMDGISNWREIVEGTDPNQNDGALSSVNNDGLAEIVTATSNLTTLMARDLYSISKYKEKYPNMDAAALSSSVADSYANLILPERVTNFSTVDTNEISFIKNYANKMAGLFETALANRDLIELIEYQKSEDDFPQTRIYLAELQNICTVARSAKYIPKSYAELHSDFIYNCELYSNVLSGIISSKTDTVRAMLSIKNHQPVVSSALNTFNQYVQKLNDDNVVFSIKENGYIFINKIN